MSTTMCPLIMVMHVRAWQTLFLKSMSLGHSHGKVAEKWGQEATARETHIHHIINDVH